MATVHLRMSVCAWVVATCVTLFCDPLVICPKKKHPVSMLLRVATCVILFCDLSGRCRRTLGEDFRTSKLLSIKLTTFFSRFAIKCKLTALSFTWCIDMWRAKCFSLCAYETDSRYMPPRQIRLENLCFKAQWSLYILPVLVLNKLPVTNSVWLCFSHDSQKTSCTFLKKRRDGQGMWHVCGREEVHTGLLWWQLMERDPTRKVQAYMGK